MGPLPVIRAMCDYAGTIQLEEVVPSNYISCSDPQKDIDNWDYVECTVTCSSEADCSKVYLNQNQSFADGPWGTIRFSCSSETYLSSLRGWLNFTDNGSGDCTFDTTSDLVGRNYRLARLGIYCDDIGDYSYDDSFIECNGLSLPWEAGLNPGNNFMCLHGDRCEETCEVDFSNLHVWSDLAYIPEQCIQSLSGEDIPAYEIQAPEPTEYLYTSKFIAEWSLNRDSYGIAANCIGTNPVVNITCSNGQIRLVETLYSTVTCSQIGSNALECTDSGQSFIGNYSGNFSGAIYVSRQHF
jgi:hypothetical protein